MADAVARGGDGGGGDAGLRELVRGSGRGRDPVWAGVIVGVGFAVDELRGECGGGRCDILDGEARLRIGASVAIRVGVVAADGGLPEELGGE